MSSNRDHSASKPDSPGDEATAQQRLVDGIRSGDAKAFEQLTRKYGPAMLAVARRLLRNESDARDCVQEAFLSVHRSIDSFEERARLGTWLYRIATNTALMRIRARRARPEELTDPHSPTYDEFSFREGPRRINDRSPEELLLQTETRGLVRTAIDSLPEDFRTVLILRDIESQSTADTAALLGISEAAVKTRLHRARNSLKARLEPLFEEDLL